MLELGPGFDRRSVKAAFEERRGATIRYVGVLRAEDIREALRGVRDAGSPDEALPLLAWLAAHPHAPEDVQRDLLEHGPRLVLLSLLAHPALAADVQRALQDHADPEVRQQARRSAARPERG